MGPVFNILHLLVSKEKAAQANKNLSFPFMSFFSEDKVLVTCENVNKIFKPELGKSYTAIKSMLKRQSFLN